MSMSIGTRIRELRKKNHLTQLELSSLLYVTDKTVSSWESDRTEPSLETLIQLSEVLDSSPTKVYHTLFHFFLYIL